MSVKIDIKTHKFGPYDIYECPWCHFDSEFRATLKQHMHGVHADEIFALQVQQHAAAEQAAETTPAMDTGAETAGDVQPHIEESE